ncbi:MAG: hypothetical protein MJ252_05535 [archaeon]|nr:hypothetical protein [archaeon]
MDYIRTKVSGKKNRYIDEKYNLDLTYITPRIIAMAFPGSGIKALYRNTIDDVSTFLKDKHGDHFIILNLSGIKYDGKKFNDNVINYDQWPDHHSPPLELLFILIEKMHSFLKVDDKNVVVVNCNAGKGRTGTLICCYLLFSGLFKKPEDAFDYYSLKRFNKGFGVTHASQKRYVNYFYDIISKRQIPLPKLRHIIRVEVSCFPFFTGSSFRPEWDINDSGKDIGKFLVNQGIKLTPENSNTPFDLTDKPIRIPIHGDILIHLYDHGHLQQTKMGRLSFNTSFIDKEAREYYFPLLEIDPYKFPINNKVKEEYGIRIYLENLCPNCGGNDSIDGYCETCKKGLWAEIVTYKHIEEFLSNYSIEANDGHTLLFGDLPIKDDIETVLEKRELLKTPKVDRRDPEEIKKQAGCFIY